MTVGQRTKKGLEYDQIEAKVDGPFYYIRRTMTHNIWPEPRAAKFCSPVA
jgi:hypothetical protein